ncbi:hypothetical protein [Mesorhizobium sp. M1B.F.Ca.ET.045.04.1.1]|uniref:hypothetical protein n=1 Tax=Mesorhizobium sp. M1B.F.Ca.ET.045.04.1.1 TaxID=2493673 RepID=UPI00167802DF|nr:hypothetical protein [Mesorhizobium sp. M1B.F.Ca.ET.045.04.1.1]
MLVLLTLSLGLNFFFIGYAAHGLRQAAAARGLIPEIAGAYSPEVREGFRTVMRDNRARPSKRCENCAPHAPIWLRPRRLSPSMKLR